MIIITTRRKQEQEQEGVTSNLSWTWLKKGEFKKETKGLLTAAQEQALRTNAIKAKIDKQAVSSKYKWCKSVDELVSPPSLRMLSVGSERI